MESVNSSHRKLASEGLTRLVPACHCKKMINSFFPWNWVWLMTIALIWQLSQKPDWLRLWNGQSLEQNFVNEGTVKRFYSTILKILSKILRFVEILNQLRFQFFTGIVDWLHKLRMNPMTDDLHEGNLEIWDIALQLVLHFPSFQSNLLFGFDFEFVNDTIFLVLNNSPWGLLGSVEAFALSILQSIDHI